MKNIEKIEFEEAMKTFIPEYVELLPGWSSNREFVGEIFDTKKDFQEQFKKFKFVSKHTDWKEVLRLNWIPKFFKPSTKEAYDAQFVVKEPEFVLPKLWHIIITTENYEILSKYFSNNLPHSVLYTKGIMGFYKENKLGHTHTQIKGYDWDFGIEITFDQFKKYVLKDEIVEKKVIEPLPQFKVIETIETITKVENNEGNQFFIGDVVKTEAGLHFKIIGFKYDENKTKILAIATDNYPEVVKDINDIEHYIEPKVEVEETLLDKAKRLYPVGTKFIACNTSEECIITTGIFQQEMGYEFINEIDNTGNDIQTKYIYHCIYSKDKWAEIIE